jgi:hypothetical protein
MPAFGVRTDTYQHRSSIVIGIAVVALEQPLQHHPHGSMFGLRSTLL